MWLPVHAVRVENLTKDDTNKLQNNVGIVIKTEDDPD